MLRRWAKFNAVGALGFFLQIAAVYVFAEVCKIRPLVASALAVETAVLHNFAWHHFLTWRDRPLGKWYEYFQRLLVFNLTNGLVSLAANILFASAFIERLGSSLLLANVLAIAMSSVVNFVLSDKIAFRSRNSSSLKTRKPAVQRMAPGRVRDFSGP